MEFDETAAREMMVCLATWCEDLLVQSTAYKIAVDTCFPQALEIFHEHVRGAAADPRIREMAGQRYAPCFACATNGLDSISAQALMDRVRARMEDAIEKDRTGIM
jgi:hypothetical protein